MPSSAIGPISWGLVCRLRLLRISLISCMGKFHPAPLLPCYAYPTLSYIVKRGLEKAAAHLTVRNTRCYWPYARQFGPVCPTIPYLHHHRRRL